METFLHSLVAHNLKNRKYAIIQNGSWAPVCGSQIKQMLEKLAGSEFITEEPLAIRSTLQTSQLNELDKFATCIVNSLNK